MGPVRCKRGVVRITRGLHRTPEGFRFEPPKSARSRREISLPPFVTARLRSHKATQRLAKGEAWSEDDLVCVNVAFEPIHPDSYSDAFKRLAEACGFSPKMRLHDVRHGVATLLLVQGIHPKVVSEMLGHSSIAITLDTYSHVVAGLGASAASAIEEALGGGNV